MLPIFSVAQVVGFGLEAFSSGSIKSVSAVLTDHMLADSLSVVVISLSLEEL